MTGDLASFWANTYPLVRKELRARYPKHAWPEDPLSAPPESRPRRKRPGEKAAFRIGPDPPEGPGAFARAEMERQLGKYGRHFRALGARVY